MPKVAKELSALEIKRLDKPGLHAVGGVSGLHLQVTPTLARSWILRASIAGKRRDLGIGAYPSVGLSQARDKARILREQISLGIDPVSAKKEALNALLAQRAALITFQQCADKYIDARSVEWKNAKHRQQWKNTLKVYAFPVIGDLPVGEVALSHISKILTPIWNDKPETASRLRGRMEAVLGWATVHGYRSGDNPARWRGHLDKLFASKGKVKPIKHFTAMASEELAAFMVQIQKRKGISARALEFTILTAARTGEALGARWSEIDLKKEVWTIPAARMKAKREHRVPLSSAVVLLLKKLPRMAECDFVFPSAAGQSMSNMAMLSLLKKMEIAAVPHGFRSTFRDWCAEYTNYPRELAEMALAHTIESKVEAAYRRGDMFEKRRKLMQEWAKFCYFNQQKTASVIAIRKQS